MGLRKTPSPLSTSSKPLMMARSDCIPKMFFAVWMNSENHCRALATKPEENALYLSDKMREALIAQNSEGFTNM